MLLSCVKFSLNVALCPNMSDLPHCIIFFFFFWSGVPFCLFCFFEKKGISPDNPSKQALLVQSLSNTVI